jgi:hypothetical protein
MTPREIVKVYQYMMSGDADNISLGIEICLQSNNEYLNNLPYFVKDKLVGLSNFYESKEVEYEDSIKEHELYSYVDAFESALYKRAEFYREKHKDIMSKLNTYIPVFADKVLANWDLNLTING